MDPPKKYLYDLVLRSTHDSVVQTLLHKMSVNTRTRGESIHHSEHLYLMSYGESLVVLLCSMHVCARLITMAGTAGKRISSADSALRRA